MPSVRSTPQDEMDQSYWDSGHEYRKGQSAKDRCKERKHASIRRGIEDYFDHSRTRKNIANSYEESFDDFDEWDDFDDLSSR